MDVCRRRAALARLRTTQSPPPAADATLEELRTVFQGEIRT